MQVYKAGLAAEVLEHTVHAFAENHNFFQLQFLEIWLVCLEHLTKLILSEASAAKLNRGDGLLAAKERGQKLAWTHA